MDDFILPPFLTELEGIESFPLPIIRNENLGLTKLPEYLSEVKSIKSFHNSIFLNQSDNLEVLISSHNLLNNPENVYIRSQGSIDDIESVNESFNKKPEEPESLYTPLQKVQRYFGLPDDDLTDLNAWKRMGQKAVGKLLNQNNDEIKDLTSKNIKKSKFNSNTIIIDSTKPIRNTIGLRTRLSDEAIYDSFTPDNQAGVYIEQSTDESSKLKTSVLDYKSVLHNIIISSDYQPNFYIAWFTINDNIYVGEKGTAIFYIDNIKINTIKPGESIKKNFGFTDVALISDANVKGDSTISFDLLETSFLDMRSFIYKITDFGDNSRYSGDYKDDENLDVLTLHIATHYGWRDSKTPAYLHMKIEDLKFVKIPGIEFSHKSKDSQVLSLTAVCRKAKLKIESHTEV